MYTIYSQDTGKINRIVAVDNIEIQLTPGEAYIEGSYSNTEYHIKDGVAVELPPKPIERSAVVKEALQKRQRILAATDWTQLPDVPLTTKTAWATYRQALRDITTQSGYPFEIVWPTPPQ